MLPAPGIVKFRKDSRGEVRWRAVAANGEIVGACTESYKNLGDARSNVDDLLAALEHWNASVRDPSRPTPPGVAELKFRTRNREYRWRAVAGNARIIGASSESFTTLGACENNAMVLLRSLSFWASERASGRPYNDLDNALRATAEWVIPKSVDEDDT